MRELKQVEAEQVSGAFSISIAIFNNIVGGLSSEFKDAAISFNPVNIFNPLKIFKPAMPSLETSESNIMASLWGRCFKAKS
ncbi:hypothetical protein FUT69_00925 [Xylella taiwanensis]|uniref:Uncharacterized protein n=1 Tax=Xylella taiwanensis TaxID=1444770 RepID=Z9JKM8_9GAMM|nr:hypothetical protein [Xylella taiwanensis]AXI83094.1 hypothetical protein AB672_03585 [Xylella taiwanensis]EWS78734.1 hypothetical protein AF72_03975 [Xylella taiwanensis]MCD8456133.1 hypothetical protein [Xylella taiwanensis]MCD8458538.1 hypothetical protein [Xylella taiwanensis]MCD8460673.1 hypothetical protein [Xylella taiwanensis]